MRRGIPLLALLGILSCSDDPSVPRMRDEIILRLAVDKSSINAGEAASIVVTVTNNFGEGISIRFPNSCQVLAFIRDPRGRIVTPGRGWNCLPVVSTLNLALDESRNFTFVWDGQSEFVGTLQPSPLPPGEYFATATLQAGSFIVHAPPVRVVLEP